MTSAASTTAAGFVPTDRTEGRRGGIRVRIAQRWHERWPHIRRTLPRDLLIVLWLAMLAQSFGLAWVATESVYVQAGLVIKGAPVRPGELAVFLYQGGSVPGYYPELDSARMRWAQPLIYALFGPSVVDRSPDARAGPRKGTAFVKYLWGVPGDRIEVIGDEVFLTNRAGRWAMGKVKPRAKSGAALLPIAPQVIPQGFVYMWAPHPDALDSRYALMGLVPASSIAGRAVALW